MSTDLDARIRKIEDQIDKLYDIREEIYSSMQGLPEEDKRHFRLKLDQIDDDISNLDDQLYYLEDDRGRQRTIKQGLTTPKIVAYSKK